MRVIKCARCGEDVFTSAPRTKYCLACATLIRIENQNKRRSGKAKPDPAHTKHITCEICGKDVIVPSKAARAKYCLECSAKAFKDSSKLSRAKEKRWLLEEPKIIKCERCGCEIILEDARQFNRKYCDACKETVYAELRKKAKDAYKKRINPDVKRCARCGIALEKQNRKYCDDCSAAAKREQEAAKKRKQREGWRTSELPRTKKKKPHVSQIVDLNEAARKAGMSYGRYVAMLAMKKGV